MKRMLGLVVILVGGCGGATDPTTAVLGTYSGMYTQTVNSANPPQVSNPSQLVVDRDPAYEFRLSGFTLIGQALSCPLSFRRVDDVTASLVVGQFCNMKIDGADSLVTFNDGSLITSHTVLLSLTGVLTQTLSSTPFGYAYNGTKN
jgi:hypothetical protein